MPPVYVFDVNETLLDLRALDAHFGRAFGDPGAREAWFQQLSPTVAVCGVVAGSGRVGRWLDGVVARPTRRG
jgi:2-haloacid dehalogenase